MTEEILEFGEEIVPGAEKKIIWYDKIRIKTHYSVVYMHGFGASHKEMTGVPEGVASGIKGNLYLTRLSGHGLRSVDGLKNVNYKEWLFDMSQAINIGEKIGDEVVVIAHSLSAMISLVYLMQHTNHNIKTIICTSPNLNLKSIFSPLIASRYGSIIVRLLLGKHRILQVENEMVKKYWTIKQPTEAIVEIARLAAVLKSYKKKYFPYNIAFIYNPHDRVIDLKYLKSFFYKLKTVKNKMLYSYSKAKRHTFAGNILSPENTEDIVSQMIQILKIMK